VCILHDDSEERDRIVTLTLLAMYVDPSFLFGTLHRDGGIVFFLLGLLLLLPVLYCCSAESHQPWRNEGIGRILGTKELKL